MSKPVHYKPIAFNIRYLSHMFEQDPHLWLVNSLTDYLNFRKDLIGDFKNSQITITKPIHPDNDGIDHFNFIANEQTFHAYCRPKEVFMCGNLKVIGTVIWKITCSKVVKKIVEL